MFCRYLLLLRAQTNFSSALVSWRFDWEVFLPPMARVTPPMTRVIFTVLQVRSMIPVWISTVVQTVRMLPPYFHPCLHSLQLAEKPLFVGLMMDHTYSSLILTCKPGKYNALAGMFLCAGAVRTVGMASARAASLACQHRMLVGDQARGRAEAIGDN